MPTIDVSTYTMRCGASPDCRHSICGHCGTAIRHSAQKTADHPGTTLGIKKTNTCQNCKQQQTQTGRQKLKQLTQARLDHISSIGSVDDRIRYADPGLHRLLQRRRKTGVPREGLRTLKETA